MEITLADYESLQMKWTLAAIAFTLLIYEYALTFISEVERFWPAWLRNILLHFKIDDDEPATGFTSKSNEITTRKKYGFTWTALFFFVNRYLGLFGQIPVMLEYFWRIENQDIRERICGKLQLYHQFLVVVTQTIIACVMTMRVYALYERRIWVFVLYSTIAVCAVGTSIWAVVNSARSEDSPVVPIPYGCGATLAADEARYLSFAWSAELVFDVFIFVMTLYKTLTLPRGGGIGLLTMIIRDGTVYFGAMVIANVGNILTFLLGGPFSRGSVTMLTNVISSIMVSRLMLNLRDPKLHTDGNGNGYAGISTINGCGFYGQSGGCFVVHGLMTSIGGDSRITISNSLGARWDPEA